MRTISFRNLAASFVLVLGLAHTVGELTGSRTIKGLAVASAASPLPKVFCDVSGYEPFAADFVLHCEMESGDTQDIPITPERYRGLSGSYNRRNAYGAALAYAPRLPEPLWQSVASYGLSPAGPVRRELNLPGNAKLISIHIDSRTRGRRETWTLLPACMDP